MEKIICQEKNVLIHVHQVLIRCLFIQGEQDMVW